MPSRAMVAQGEKRRRAILRFISSYIRTHGISPTFAEIADAVGLSSPNATRNHLKKLSDDGHIRIYPHTPRGIVVVDPSKPLKKLPKSTVKKAS